MPEKRQTIWQRAANLMYLSLSALAIQTFAFVATALADGRGEVVMPMAQAVGF